jgi:hypothetical protein
MFGFIPPPPTVSYTKSGKTKREITKGGHAGSAEEGLLKQIKTTAN